MKNCSSFETDAVRAEPLIAAFRKVKFNNRRVQIEFAGRQDRKEKENKGYPKSRDFSAPNKKRKK